MKTSWKFLGITLILLFLTAAADRIFYGRLIFLFENHSGWDSFRWYNFERNLRLIERGEKRRSDAARILVVGSSIAQYSIQKHVLEVMVESVLQRPAEVEAAVHSAMLPVDLRFYADRLNSYNPDLVVYITNPADLDLERYVPPWEAGSDYSNSSERNYISSRYPMLVYYSLPYSIERTDLSLDRRLSLALQGLFYSARFRHEWTDALDYEMKFEGVVKSYLNYQGMKIPQGIWRDGNTGGCFSFPRRVLKNDLDLEIPAGLTDSGDFFLELFEFSGDGPGEARIGEYLWNGDVRKYESMTPENKVSLQRELRRISDNPSLLDDAVPGCDVPAGARRLLTYRPEKPGWQKLPEIAGTGWIFVRLNRVLDEKGVSFRITPGDPVYTGRGVRLPGTFGVSPQQRENDWLVRRRSLEDLRLAAMNIRQYERDYEQRIQPDDWSSPEHTALRQLNMLRISKYFVGWHEFKEIEQLKELKKYLNKMKGRVLIISNPENPIAGDEYSGSRWMKDYLKYMNSLAERSGGRVIFRDFHSRLGSNNFVDPHHLTYDGMLRMAPVYAQAIAEALRSKD